MKKVSTGERIKFADLRRRSVGISRDADSDATQSEQRFVSELMDTTPSSSYEGETLRDGYAYNPPDPSVSDSPLARYESDGEGADEVVTGTQEGVGKADLIVKEDVPEVWFFKKVISGSDARFPKMTAHQEKYSFGFGHSSSTAVHGSSKTHPYMSRPVRISYSYMTDLLSAGPVVKSIFTVPQIPEETQQGSLLAAGLAAVKINASQSGLGGLLTGPRQRDDTMTLSDGESLMGDPRVDHGTDHGPGGCTVSK